MEFWMVWGYPDFGNLEIGGRMLSFHPQVGLPVGEAGRGGVGGFLGVPWHVMP